MHTAAAEDRWDNAYVGRFPPLLVNQGQLGGRFNQDRSAFAEQVELWSITRDMLSSLCDQHFGHTFDWLACVDGASGDELYLGDVCEEERDGDADLIDVVAFEDHGIATRPLIPVLALIHKGVLEPGIYRLTSHFAGIDEPLPAWKD